MGECDAETLDWTAVRYQRTPAVRAKPAEYHAPATANKMVTALRGVLRETRRLRLLSAEDCAAAGDVPAVKGSTLLRGRALAAGELRGRLETCAADISA